MNNLRKPEEFFYLPHCGSFFFVVVVVCFSFPVGQTHIEVQHYLKHHAMSVLVLENKSWIIIREFLHIQMLNIHLVILTELRNNLRDWVPS